MGVLLNYKNWKRLYETALSIDTPAVAGDRFAEILKSNYQVKEQPKGSNKGPEVSKYLSATGLGPGYPWCMAFVYSMFSDLSSALGISNPLPKTAGVLNHWSKADSSLKITIDAARKNPGLVKPGQIFIMSRPGKGTGHTGIVVSVDITNRSFKSIEGNTNDQLSGEGDRVGINKRELSANSLIGFIDYFKGSRDEKFENTISQTLTNQKTDFSADTKDNIDSPTTANNQDINMAQIKSGAKLLKLGMKGEEVTKVQAKLGVTQSGNYDAATDQAVRKFQSENKDTSGAPLKVDGIVGPITYGALFGVQISPEVIAKASPTQVNQVNQVNQVDVILMGGLDYRQGDLKIDKQVELLNSGTSGGKKILGHRYTELTKVLDSIAQNPNAKVVLFSAGGTYSKQVANAMQNKSNLYIVEPYAASANTKTSVQSAVTAGVPSKNVLTGSSVGRGKDVIAGATLTPSNKGHWDALQYVGSLI